MTSVSALRLPARVSEAELRSGMRPAVLTIAGSPAPRSRTERLMALMNDELRADGINVDRIHVGDLPADDLFHARTASCAIRDAIAKVDAAEGIVIGTPIYNASYTGILKAFLDVLPRRALEGKTVLPIAIGGSVAHLLAIDYALRPVLSSLGARHVVGGVFVHDKLIEVDAAGTTRLESEIQERIHVAIREFTRALRAHAAT